jgi:hypothetical protein
MRTARSYSETRFLKIPTCDSCRTLRSKRSIRYFCVVVMVADIVQSPTVPVSRYLRLHDWAALLAMGREALDGSATARAEIPLEATERPQCQRCIRIQTAN